MLHYVVIYQVKAVLITQFQSIANESSTLFDNDNNNTQLENLSTKAYGFIGEVFQRLNGLIDRGHSIYDKVENLLSKCWASTLSIDKSQYFPNI